MKHTTIILALAAVALTAGCIEALGFGPYFTELTNVFNTLAGAFCTLYYALVGAAGAVAALLVAYSGLKWVMSRGEPMERKHAKDVIELVILGLVLIASAKWIVLAITGTTCP